MNKTTIILSIACAVLIIFFVAEISYLTGTIGHPIKFSQKQDEAEMQILHQAVSYKKSPCWNDPLAHIYHPDRLQVLDPCKTVAGVVHLVRSEPDGDVHIQLRPDFGYQSLTNDANTKKQDSSLVLEIICEHKITQTDAVSACNGYVNTIQKPKAGDHVKAVGAYVKDLKHGGWTELHPVYSLEMMKPYERNLPLLQ